MAQMNKVVIPTVSVGVLVLIFINLRWMKNIMVWQATQDNAIKRLLDRHE